MNRTISLFDTSPLRCDAAGLKKGALRMRSSNIKSISAFPFLRKFQSDRYGSWLCAPLFCTIDSTFVRIFIRAPFNTRSLIDLISFQSCSKMVLIIYHILTLLLMIRSDASLSERPLQRIVKVLNRAPHSLCLEGGGAPSSREIIT